MEWTALGSGLASVCVCGFVCAALTSASLSIRRHLCTPPCQTKAKRRKKDAKAEPFLSLASSPSELEPGRGRDGRRMQSARSAHSAVRAHLHGRRDALAQTAVPSFLFRVLLPVGLSGSALQRSEALHPQATVESPRRRSAEVPAHGHAVLEYVC